MTLFDLLRCVECDEWFKPTDELGPQLECPKCKAFTEKLRKCPFTGKLPDGEK